MPKINVKNPIVNINGDEMARVLWARIKQKLILPFIHINLLDFDLCLESREKTNDAITTAAAKSILSNQVGVKCATITPDDKRIQEYNLSKKYPSPNGTIRKVLNGTIFREPIIIKNVPKIVNHWNKSVIIARHAYGDIYQAKEVDLNSGEKLVLEIRKKNESIVQEVHSFDSPGVGLAYFNLDKSIEDFAYACFNFALKKKIPVFLSTKNTILQKYDERFKQIFDDIYKKKFQENFQKIGLEYQHRLIDDMVACFLKWSGGYLWACKNYDGDVISDLVAQGYGSLGLMTSILQSPDGKIVETEAAHGTVTSHFRQHQNGLQTSTNPVASIFAWTRALWFRGDIDNQDDLKKFAKNLEHLCIQTLEDGIMTKDLALMVGPNQKWKTTNELLDILENKLRNLKN
tara:strand:- start:106 stop:1314 length:1209 start_codon:yes stop_codon:yes gene_type:complete